MKIYGLIYIGIGVILFILLGGIIYILVTGQDEDYQWYAFNSQLQIEHLAAGITTILVMLFALWRSYLLHRQTDTALQSNLNDRYKTGTELLGNCVLSIRIGGIYALANLADERPKLYHIQVMKLFCFTVRFPPPDTSEPDNKVETEDKTVKVREDIQEIITIIGRRKKEGQRKKEKIERKANYRLDLRDAKLSGANLEKADLSETILFKAILSRAFLFKAILSGANLEEAILSEACLREAELLRAYLREADLSEAFLLKANLSTGTDLSEAKRLIKAKGRTRSIVVDEANRLGFPMFKVNPLGTNLEKANLSGADLTKANLSEAHLSGAILTGANLLEADLTLANLSEAFLTKKVTLSSVQDIRKTDLSRAELIGANLTRADLSEAVLKEADLSGVILCQAILSGADLSGVKGLTQDELNTAIADPSYPPPTLTGARDPETVHSLEWQKT